MISGVPNRLIASFSASRHGPVSSVTESRQASTFRLNQFGYAADWTVDQLREPAQRVADRIDELMKC